MRPADVTVGDDVTEQSPARPGRPPSGPELEFLRRWRPLIDRVGGDGGQARAAKHLNWTTSTVSRDYKGDTLPTDQRLHQLCSALQLSPNETLDLAVVLRRARSARRDRVRSGDPQPAVSGQEIAEPQDAGTGQHAAPSRWSGHRDWLRGRRGRVAGVIGGRRGGRGSGRAGTGVVAVPGAGRGVPAGADRP